MSNTLSTITSTTTTRPVLPVATEKVTGPTLLAAVFGGKVRFSKVRAEGTLRTWPVLEPKSDKRKAAEKLASDVEKGGANGVAIVSKAQHVSPATVRRTLMALKFTLELEGMTAKAKAEVAKAANANMEAKPEPKVEAPKVEPKTEAKKATPAKPKAPAKATPAKPVSKAAKGKAHAEKMAAEAKATTDAAKATLPANK